MFIFLSLDPTLDRDLRFFVAEAAGETIAAEVEASPFWLSFSLRCDSWRDSSVCWSRVDRGLFVSIMESQEVAEYSKEAYATSETS